MSDPVDGKDDDAVKRNEQYASLVHRVLANAASSPSSSASPNDYAVPQAADNAPSAVARLEQPPSSTPTASRNEQPGKHVKKTMQGDLKNGVPTYAAKRKTTGESDDEDKDDAAKYEHRRKLNLIHSRRKRERQKIEIEVMKDQIYHLRERNRKLDESNLRFEAILASAQESVRLFEQQLVGGSSSAYDGPAATVDGAGTAVCAMDPCLSLNAAPVIDLSDQASGRANSWHQHQLSPTSMFVQQQILQQQQRQEELLLFLAMQQNQLLLSPPAAPSNLQLSPQQQQNYHRQVLLLQQLMQQQQRQNQGSNSHPNSFLPPPPPPPVP
jgi:hypothetical protein